MVALPKIGLNEGSLLRRTVLHVATFLLGSVAFIGVVSLVLVTIARGIVAPKEAAAEGDEPETVASATPAAPRAPRTQRVRLPNRGKSRTPTPAAPAKED